MTKTMRLDPMDYEQLMDRVIDLERRLAESEASRAKVETALKAADSFADGYALSWKNLWESIQGKPITKNDLRELHKTYRAARKACEVTT